MKKYFLLFALISLFMNFGIIKSQVNTGLFTMSYNEGGVQHPISFYVPEDYSAEKAYPMIFGWHGAGMAGTAMAGWLHQTIAQQEKIILVCVDINNAQTSQTLLNIVQQSLAYATQTYNIDMAKIVISGYSMGGAYSYIFGLSNATYFKGIIGTAPAIALDNFSEEMWSAVPNIRMATILGESDEMFGMIDSSMKEIKVRGGQLLYKKKPGVTHGDGNYFNSQEYKDDYKECWDYIFLATDIEENLINNIGIELYPNPVSSIANVSYTIDKSSNVSVSIQNAIGETLIKGIENTYLNAGDYNDIINTASLVPGVYYCIIKTESNTISKKFVVMK